MTSAHFPTTSTQRAEMALSTLVKPDTSTVSSAQKALNKCWLSSLKRGRKVPVGNYYWKNLNSDTNTEILSRIKKKKGAEGTFFSWGLASHQILSHFFPQWMPATLSCLSSSSVFRHFAVPAQLLYLLAVWNRLSFILFMGTSCF